VFHSKMWNWYTKDRTGNMCSVGGTCGRGNNEWWRLKWGNMVDGLYSLMWIRTKKPLAVALSGVGSGVNGREDGGDLTNV
jgi:hypothetical protein